MNARDIAWEYHNGQMYGNASYMLGHVCDVVDRVAGVGNHLHVAIAYLHDTIEDTSLTLEKLRNLLKEDESDSEYVDAVVDAVDALTKRGGEDYTAYMSRVMQNKHAAFVKYYDSESNMYACIRNGNYQWAQKYLKNMCMLKDFV
jgi:(p)ppGpp synthase/HD superfamily hydrolase